MEQEKEMYEHAREIAANELENTKNEYSATEVRQLLMKMFPDAKTYADEKTKKELIEFLEMVATCGKNTDFDRWSKADCAKWIFWVKNKQHPMQHYISLEKKDSNGVIDCLLEHFKNCRESGEDEMWFRWTGNMLDEVIDYLEEIKRAKDKWSDTKPSEDAIDCREIYMADHKRVFNVGDWIINKQDSVYVYQIVKEDNGSFLLRNTDSIATTYLPIQVVENNYRHWNIEDSKPGDILSIKFDNWEKIVLFIECTERGVTGYGISLKDGKIFDEDEKIIYSQTWSLVLKPATAEQRERLFKEFDAYGYKWDAKRKKMMLPDQNSNIESWSFEDEKSLNIILDVLYNKTSISSEKCQEIEKWLYKLKERLR